jgi:ribosomal protein S18 acetylase RimI-like enzyme
MVIIQCEEEKLKKDFLPIIIDLWCGNKFDPKNDQHIKWLNHKIHATFENFSIALCAYTEQVEPIGFIWYKHDTGMEGVSFSGKVAYIIQIGLFEKYQHQGIGTKILNEACLKIKSAGGECLYADTYANDNDQTISFYLKRKFIPIAYHLGENGINDYGQIYFYKILRI